MKQVTLRGVRKSDGGAEVIQGIDAGPAVGSMPDASWVLAFGAAARLAT